LYAVTHVKHSILATGLLALAAASAVVTGPAKAGEDDSGLFLSPFSGLLVAVPGIDAAHAIVTATALGESNVEASQSLVGNTLYQEGGAASVDFTDSGNEWIGVLSINQEAGNMNQQANLRSIVIVDASGGPAVLHVDVNTSQELKNNHVTLMDAGPRSVAIDGSFNGASGIVGINQAAGNLNQQLGVIVVGVGLGADAGAIQLGDAQLEQIGTPADNTLEEEGTKGPRTNTLSNSFNDFSGIAQISQTTGDMNRVTQVIGVTITTPGAP
jgi:hypothetical protein